VEILATMSSVCWLIQIILDLAVFVPASCGAYSKTHKPYSIPWFVANVIFNVSVTTFCIVVAVVRN